MTNHSGEPLGYATAYCPQNDAGVAANAAGEISIEVQESTDSLIFSTLGYKSRIVVVSDLMNVNSVILEPQDFTIQEITVTAESGFEPLLGAKTISMGMCGSPGQLLLVKVNNPAFAGKTISKLIAEKRAITPSKKKSKKEKPEAPTCNLRCRVFAIGADGLPAHDLLSVNILARVVPEAETIEVDLGEYDITVPENGVMVGFEWLPATQAYTWKTFFHPAIKMTDAVDNPYTLIGNMKGEWKWLIFSDWKKDLPFFISKKMRNAKIGIETAVRQPVTTVPQAAL